jgi:hypothetical protein
MCVYIHCKIGAGVGFTRRPGIYQQYVTLKIQLNDKTIGRNEHDRTQRNVCLLCAVLNVMRYFVNIFSPNKVVDPIMFVKLYY